MTYALGREGRATLGRLLSGKVLLAFDFDGTLAPIVRDPRRACLRASTRRLLLAVAARHPVAVVSGRSTLDVSGRLSGIPVRWVIGNHGVDLDPNPAETREKVLEACHRLRPLVASLEGAVLEDKGHSLSLHYRACRHAARAQETLAQGLAAAIPEFRVIPGKKVLSAMPHGSLDKGDALLWAWSRARATGALFVGDDVTDEDAFAVRRQEFLSVRVGRSTQSRAACFVRDQGEVDVLLECVLETKERT